MENGVQNDLMSPSGGPSKIATGDKHKENMLSGNIVLVILVFVLIGALIGVGYLYYSEKTKNADGGSRVATEQEVKDLKEKVGSHLLLTDEDPAVATIIDIVKLKETNPEFYKNAKDGDKLLVYSNRAILYDPEADIILNVAPIINPEKDDKALGGAEGEGASGTVKSGSDESGDAAK